MNLNLGSVQGRGRGDKYGFGPAEGVIEKGGQDKGKMGAKARQAVSQKGAMKVTGVPEVVKGTGKGVPVTCRGEGVEPGVIFEGSLDKVIWQAGCSIAATAAATTATAAATAATAAASAAWV